MGTPAILLDCSFIEVIQIDIDIDRRYRYRLYRRLDYIDIDIDKRQIDRQITQGCTHTFKHTAKNTQPNKDKRMIYARELEKHTNQKDTKKH